MRRAAPYALFFLSGLCALAYELVWQRLLHLVLGVSTLSVSAVLTAFLGGLALGGLLFGRLADRARSPLRLYSAIEAGIALTALLVPPGFALLARLYTALHTAWHPGPWRGALSYSTSSTYGALFRDTVAENLLGLLACRADVAPFVAHAPGGAALLRHRVASGEVLLGHVLQQHGDGRGALAHYRAASALLPGDRALGGLVQACRALVAGR
jgi:MFS family permease